MVAGSAWDTASTSMWRWRMVLPPSRLSDPAFVPCGTCTIRYSPEHATSRGNDREPPGPAARRGRRVRVEPRRRRREPPAARYRHRHEPPDAHLPLRVEGGVAHRGDPRRGGATARAPRGAPRRSRPRPRRGRATHVAAPRGPGAVAERAPLLRDL